MACCNCESHNSSKEPISAKIVFGGALGFMFWLIFLLGVVMPIFGLVSTFFYKWWMVWYMLLYNLVF